MSAISSCSKMSQNRIQIISYENGKTIVWGVMDSRNITGCIKMIAYFMGMKDLHPFYLRDEQSGKVENLTHAGSRYGVTKENRKAFLK